MLINVRVHKSQVILVWTLMCIFTRLITVVCFPWGINVVLMIPCFFLAWGTTKQSWQLVYTSVSALYFYRLWYNSCLWSLSGPLYITVHAVANPKWIVYILCSGVNVLVYPTWISFFIILNIQILFEFSNLVCYQYWLSTFQLYTEGYAFPVLLSPWVVIHPVRWRVFTHYQ